MIDLKKQGPVLSIRPQCPAEGMIIQAQLDESLQLGMQRGRMKPDATISHKKASKLQDVQYLGPSRGNGTPQRVRQNDSWRGGNDLIRVCTLMVYHHAGVLYLRHSISQRSIGPLLNYSDDGTLASFPSEEQGCFARQVAASMYFVLDPFGDSVDCSPGAWN